MKKYLLFGLLAILFTAAFSHDAIAQKKGKKKKSSATDEYFNDNGFLNKLWYGGSFTLGYAGGSNQSYFAFGLAPMVGYKFFNDVVSVGPRVGFEYNNVRLKTGGVVYKANPLSYSVGVFSRIKPFQNFFAQLEYEYQNADSTDPDEDGFIELDPSTGKIQTTRVAYDNVYIGAGYNSGGVWAYEILLLFNVNQPATTVASPFNIRFGFTHKF